MKQNPKIVVVPVRFSKFTWDRIKARAKDNDISAAEQLRRIIRVYWMSADDN